MKSQEAEPSGAPDSAVASALDEAPAAIQLLQAQIEKGEQRLESLETVLNQMQASSVDVKSQEAEPSGAPDSAVTVAPASTPDIDTRRHVHMVMRMVISRMRSNSLDSVFSAWSQYAQHRTRVARLAHRAIVRAEQAAVVRAFSPWLATARELRVRQLQQQHIHLEASLANTNDTIKERELEIEQRVAAAAETRRKRLIEKTLVRLIDELQKKSLARALFSWHSWVAHKIHTRIVAAKAEMVVANSVLRSLFRPWLLAARDTNATLRQQKVSALEQTIMEGVQQLGNQNDTMELLGARLTEQAEQRRRHTIQKEVVRRMVNIQHGSVLHAFEGWRDSVAWKVRIGNLQRRAVLSVGTHQVAIAFKPWLAAARRSKLTQQVEELAALKLQLQSTQDDSSARMERLRTDSATEISEMRRREEELQGETLGLVEERFEALRARNSELEVEQVEKRRKQIELAASRYIGRMLKKHEAEAFIAWQDFVARKKRAHNLCNKTILHWENRVVSAAFMPWLSTARDLRERKTREALEALEARNAELVAGLAGTGLREAIEDSLLSKEESDRESKLVYAASQAYERLDDVSVSAAFRPWLTAARSFQTRRMTEQIEALEEDMAGYQAKAASHFTALAEQVDGLRRDDATSTATGIVELEQSIAFLREDHDRELDSRAHEVALMNDALQAVEQKSRAAAVETSQKLGELRVSRIERIMTRLYMRMQRTSMTRVFEAWRLDVEHTRRVQNISTQVICRMENLTIARTFTPWLAAARRTQLEVLVAGKPEPAAQQSDFDALKSTVDSLAEQASQQPELEALKSNVDSLTEQHQALSASMLEVVRYNHDKDSLLDPVTGEPISLVHALQALQEQVRHLHDKRNGESSESTDALTQALEAAQASIAPTVQSLRDQLEEKEKEKEDQQSHSQLLDKVVEAAQHHVQRTENSEQVLEKLWQWVADMQEQQDTVCLPLLSKLARAEEKISAQLADQEAKLSEAESSFQDAAPHGAGVSDIVAQSGALLQEVRNAHKEDAGRHLEHMALVDDALRALEEQVQEGAQQMRELGDKRDQAIESLAKTVQELQETSRSDAGSDSLREAVAAVSDQVYASVVPLMKRLAESEQGLSADVSTHQSALQMLESRQGDLLDKIGEAGVSVEELRTQWSGLQQLALDHAEHKERRDAEMALINDAIRELEESTQATHRDFEQTLGSLSQAVETGSSLTGATAQDDMASELAKISVVKDDLRSELEEIKSRQEEHDQRLAKEIDLINKALQVHERDIAESSAAAASAAQSSAAAAASAARSLSPAAEDGEGETSARSIEEGVPPMLEPADETEPEVGVQGSRPWTPSVDDAEVTPPSPPALEPPAAEQSSPNSFTTKMAALPQRVDTVEGSLEALGERLNQVQAAVELVASSAEERSRNEEDLAKQKSDQVEEVVLKLQQRASELSNALHTLQTEKQTDSERREQDTEELRARAEHLSAQLEQQASAQTERLALVEKTLAAQADDLGAVAAGVQAAGTSPDSPGLGDAVAALQAQTAQISLDLAHATMQKTGEMVLINDALAEIDELIKSADQSRPGEQRALGDQLRTELQEELEHVEVTLREEFVAVQLQVDRLGREMSRISRASGEA